MAVGDGEQAIARIPTERPDIVLADIGMPKRSGYEVAAFVKGHPEFKHIPVLLLAGAFEPVDDAKAEQAGCDGVLVKPFEPQHVIARVRELLDGAKGSPTQAAAADRRTACGDARIRTGNSRGRRRAGRRLASIASGHAVCEVAPGAGGVDHGLRSDRMCRLVDRDVPRDADQVLDRRRRRSEPVPIDLPVNNPPVGARRRCRRPLPRRRSSRPKRSADAGAGRVAEHARPFRTATASRLDPCGFQLPLIVGLADPPMRLRRLRAAEDDSPPTNADRGCVHGLAGAGAGRARCEAGASHHGGRGAGHHRRAGRRGGPACARAARTGAGARGRRRGRVRDRRTPGSRRNRPDPKSAVGRAQSAGQAPGSCPLPDCRLQ